MPGGPCGVPPRPGTLMLSGGGVWDVDHGFGAVHGRGLRAAALDGLLRGPHRCGRLLHRLFAAGRRKAHVSMLACMHALCWGAANGATRSHLKCMYDGIDNPL